MEWEVLVRATDAQPESLSRTSSWRSTEGDVTNLDMAMLK
ncbi:hypothetical protein F444_18483 [Phytophthora nicotianae P1976]|uniref:Uncharacterized protein n=1 Tax=Phytophthora nicotianae P1976 TaxID=1317066 RepID=A0A080ZB73_PHYNI|nr:hypothetical protein F444_18483 [Phytophthora nicotianae P1976]